MRYYDSLKFSTALTEKLGMEYVWSLYGPWVRLVLQIGILLVLLATPATFLFEKDSLPRLVLKRVAAFGATLVLLGVAFFLIISALERAFSSAMVP